MSGLGYALLHPVQIETTAGEYPWKQRFDDGVDVVASVVGAGDLSAYSDAFERELELQLGDLAGQVSALAGPGGPFEFFTRLGDLVSGDVDLAALLRQAGDFLCNLDVTVSTGLIVGLFDRVRDGLSFTEPVDLAHRVRALTEAALGVLEQPLLSGRDDVEAHRGYRAAALIRHLIADGLDRLEDLLEDLDPIGEAREFLLAIPDIDERIVSLFRTVGCTLRDRVAPIVDAAMCFSGSVSVDIDPDGPSGMAAAVPLADDTKITPFPVGHAVWIADLSTGTVSLALTIYELGRTKNPPERVTQFLHDLLVPIWKAFRIVMRAVRWDGIEANGFTRFLFSEWGDFAVHLVLNVFAAFGDYAFSNGISNIGFRTITYLFYTLQVRSIYLFLRSGWYWRQWLDEGKRDDPGIPLHRFVWLSYPISWLISDILGWVYGGALWEWVSVRRFWLPLVTGGLTAMALVWLPFALEGVDWAVVKSSPGHGFIVAIALVTLLLIAILQFSQVAEFETNTAGQAALWTTFASLTALLAVAGGLSLGGVAAGDGILRVYDWVSVMAFGALLVAGTLPALSWWYAIAEGSDREDVFEPLDTDTTPYRLPFASGDTWFVGQGFHGFWSHQARDGGGFDRAPGSDDDFNDNNRYSYDFCEKRGTDILASRPGLISRFEDDVPTGSPNLPGATGETANRVQAMNLDWQEGHDPGWSEERQLTYSSYLHLEQRGVVATLGQFVRRGLHIAELDDTGNSAMEHLHFHADSTPGGTDVNVPVVFRGEGAPGSTSFVTSTNDVTTALSFITVQAPLSNAGTPDHTHVARIDAVDLPPDGSIPASLTVATDGPSTGPDHRHELTFSADQVRELLRHRDVTGVTSTMVGGHSHTTIAYPLSGNTILPNARVDFAAAPAGRLVATRRAPLNLLGEQFFIRVDGRATEWFSWGAHRPSVRGDLTLDRGLAPGSPLVVDGTKFIAGDVMARAAARQLSTGDLTVRVVPVLVLETVQRGSGAAVAVVAAPNGLDPVVPAGAGSGVVADVGAISAPELRAVLTAELTQQAAPTVSVGGAPPALTVGGAPVSAIAGTPRLADVVGAAYDAAIGQLRVVDPLPASTGVLDLTGGATLSVPIVAAPARLVIPDRAAARLAGADLVAEPLTVTVRDDAQIVRFRPTDDSPAGVAERINCEAEGVRARPEGSSLVIETVAAGQDVTLRLAKDAITFAAGGAAPELTGGVRLADSTALSVATLTAAITRARADAVAATAAVTVAGTGQAVRIEAATSTDVVRVEGPAALMEALGVPPAAPADVITAIDAPEAIELTAGPLPHGGWLDITVGGATSRVNLPAEPGRAELVVEALPAATTDLQLDVGGAVDIALGPDDVASPHALASRITTAAAGRLTVRIAYRTVFERATWGGGGLGDLEVGANSQGTMGAGLTVPTAVDAERAPGYTGASSTDPTAAVEFPDARAVVDGTVARSFSASVEDAGLGTEHVLLGAADGGDVTIAAQGADPFGLNGVVAAGPTIGSGPIDLGPSSVAYDVTTTGHAPVTVELNAAPARVHANPGAPDFVPADGVAVALRVSTTDPAGTVRAADVDLVGVTTLVELAERLQRDAPHVRAWTVAGNRLDIETPSGGTGWSLRVEGADSLLALAVERRDLDGAGGVDATGQGNVRDGRRATLTEIAEVFDTVGARSVIPAAESYTASTSGTTLTIASPIGQVGLTSDPPSLAATLGPAIAGSTVTVNGAGFTLDPGWLLVSTGGQPAGMAPIWGRRAWIESDPIGDAEVVIYTAAATASIGVVVNGAAPVNVTVGGIATVADLVSALTVAVPGAFFGHVVRPDGSRVLRVESRARGTASRIGLRLNAAGLGFAAATVDSPTSGPGSSAGNVADLGSVGLAELEDALNRGRGFGPRQALVDATDTGASLRLTARGASNLTLTVTGAGWDQILLARPGTRTDQLEAVFPTPIDTGADLLELRAQSGAPAPVDRTVRALLRLAPARIGPMALANPAALNGGTLALRAAAPPFTVTFTGVATTADVVDQIQRAGNGVVRASLSGAELVVETVAEGTDASLQVDVTASSVLASGGPLGAPPATSAQGSGDATDGRRVRLDQVRGVVVDAAIGPPSSAAARSVPTVFSIREGVTGAGAVVEQFVGRSSPRTGADSAVEILTVAATSGDFADRLDSGPPQLLLDMSMARGPACRAAITLPPFTDAAGAPITRDLVGGLVISFDDNGPASDLGAPVEVRVSFDGTYTASEAAAEIDAALSAAGVGCAGAYPDQVVVIETLTPGLAGTVEVPAAGQPSTGSVLAAVGLDAAAPRWSRGFPLQGFRGHAGPARADATWTFGTLPAFSVTASQTAAEVAVALDAALRRDPTGSDRVGLAVVDVDGALAVDFFAASTTLTSPEEAAVTEDAPRTVERWRGAETAVDPAFELRSTTLIRTGRMVFVDTLGGADAFADEALWGTGAFAVSDLGWVRRHTDGTGADVDIRRVAPGRWLLAARVAGARLDRFTDGNRTRAYSPSAEMIASAGTTTIGTNTVHFPHIVRHWLSFRRSGEDLPVLRMVRVGGDYLLDHLQRPT